MKLGSRYRNNNITQATTHPLANMLGEYCGPHTASSVSLIIIRLDNSSNV